MRINRVWAMPNKWTFTIKPIKELLVSHGRLHNDTIVTVEKKIN